MGPLWGLWALSGPSGLWGLCASLGKAPSAGAPAGIFIEFARVAFSILKSTLCSTLCGRCVDVLDPTAHKGPTARIDCLEIVGVDLCVGPTCKGLRVRGYVAMRNTQWDLYCYLQGF